MPVVLTTADNRQLDFWINSIPIHRLCFHFRYPQRTGKKMAAGFPGHLKEKQP